MRYNFHLKQFTETSKERDKIAIAGSDRDISWQTLGDETIALAAKLEALGLAMGEPVIIFGHKEYLFPLAMLACMHAGIPYVPIDKIYPIERIKKIVEKTGSHVIINCSEDELNLDISISFNNKLEIETKFTPQLSSNNYESSSDPLLYIMFTSGSTGEPKGVQITRKASLEFIDWAYSDFGFNANDVFMNQAPFTFDVSLSDIFNAFNLGGTLVLNSSELVKNQDEFLDRISKYKCTVWTSTPSFVYLFLRRQDFNSIKLNSLHTFIFMGEELPSRSVTILKSNFKAARVFNAYGPTEATIATTLIEIDNDILKKYPSLPIGFPMPNSELYVEKENMLDIAGELIIVGDHVSIGYFKNEELNNQKFFIRNGKRAFKTGDLAYYEDGMLFYLGRNDDQVKMNGFRIELSEISNVICLESDVTDAVTVALKRNKEVKKIISFVIPSSARNTNELKNELIQKIEIKLPYYMIPGDIVFIDEFPYSASHKIDKNKLIETYLKGIN